MDGHGAYPDPVNAKAQFSTSTAAGHGFFPPLRASASDLTQSSVADASDSNSPPSTSSSIQFGTDPGANSKLNSQATMADEHPSLLQLQTTSLPRSLERTDSGHDTVAFSPFHSPPSARGTVQLTPGQKRTASGGMKYSVSPDRPYSLMTPTETGYHSRSMSTDSHSNRIAEISAQLRSRLSWAAAKVEKDWKSNPNGSKLGSPGKKSSPRGIRASAQPNGPSISSQAPKVTGPVGERDLAAEVLRIATGFSSPRPDISRRKSSNHSPRSYHRHNLSVGSTPSNAPYERPSPNNFQQIPRLAPPADIVPRNGTHARRKVAQNRTSPKKLRIPSLSQQSSNSSAVGTNGSCRIPATPPQPQPSFKAPSSATTAILGRHCTSAQKTIMEQDAVETLVFMGSPENSGYYNDSRSQTNPPSNSQDSLQYNSAPSLCENISAPTSSTPGFGTAFSFEPRGDPPQAKRVSFADHGGETPYASCSRPRLEQDAGDEIDRMLDEMGDSDNEPDYDWFAHMSGARDNFSLPQQRSQ
ncbi:hypothetical protein MferCBS31731_004876 [Microsporum ferrugineum]